MLHKCIPGYWFSKWVCYHFIVRNVFQNHFILHYHISDEMISNMDMFGLPMILQILSISQCSHVVTGSKVVLTTLMSCKNLLNQTASYIAKEQATYSASIVDKATQYCCLLPHDITQSFNKNAYPNVDLR